ncbi:MAG: YIP1 family protein [Anaerolineales bacterium]|nr:YIP1 family protein [Anaerolineales bacterium]
MTETTPTVLPSASRSLKRLVRFLFFPRHEFAQLAEQERLSWVAPMLTLSLTLLLTVLVSGLLRARAAAMGEMPLPPGWEWWTPEMQKNYKQAMQAMQSPVFLYVIPAVVNLAGLWLGWSILSGFLHLASTLLGGRSHMASALVIVAWASLPLALRDLLRVGYMLSVGHTITSPGLSGFVTSTSGGALFLAGLLEQVDIFLIWRAVLLVFGFQRLDGLSTGKAITATLVVLALVLTAQAGLGALLTSLSGMIINQPF